MIDIHSQESVRESDSPWDDIDERNHLDDLRDEEQRQDDFDDDA